jgi:hypothetical protein
MRKSLRFVISRLLVSLLLVWSPAAAIVGSASAADTSQSACYGQQSCVPPEAPIDPPASQRANPQQAALDSLRRRAQRELDIASQRLARAERERKIAESRRLRFLQLAKVRRTRVNRLRERAASAQKRADAAERQMVHQRRRALEEVQAQRAAYGTVLIDWLASRATMFTAAVGFLLMAFFAAGWRSMIAWVAFRRTRGLDGATYSKALAVVATAVSGGAVAVSALSPMLNGALSAVAVPLIAAAVVLIGAITWRSTTVKVGTAGVPVALEGRRLFPGMAVVLTLVIGVGIALIGVLDGKPAEQHVAPRTAALARLAEPDATTHPTARVARMRTEAYRADRRARRAEGAY